MFRKIVEQIRKLGVKIAVLFISLYRYMISPFLGDNCRFYPSCSSYAREAIETFGILYGCWLTIKRIAKCHPWHSGGYDPIPKKDK